MILRQMRHPMAGRPGSTTAKKCTVPLSSKYHLGSTRVARVSAHSSVLVVTTAPFVVTASRAESSRRCVDTRSISPASKPCSAEPRRMSRSSHLAAARSPYRFSTSRVSSTQSSFRCSSRKLSSSPLPTAFTAIARPARSSLVQLPPRYPRSTATNALLRPVANAKPKHILAIYAPRVQATTFWRSRSRRAGRDVVRASIWSN